MSICECVKTAVGHTMQALRKGITISEKELKLISDC